MVELKLIKDLGRLDEELKKQIKGFFKGRIAVKVHMGETHNPYFLKPSIIKRIVKVLLDEGLEPFLFDSVVLYAGGRDSVEKYYKTAEEHGFTSETIGCEIVISETPYDVQAKDLKIHVCKELKEADGMLVVSHVKGHRNSGFGAAIKNLGMGGVTPESKKDIHKSDNFDDALAQGAWTVLHAVGEKVFYVNFLINISEECDCCNDAGEIVVKDLGVLFGKDIVAIDKASLDLINEQKKDIFKKLHNKDPFLHVKYAVELGMGEEEYVIS